MSARVQAISTQAGKRQGYTFYCPGCEGWHMFHTEPWESVLPRRGPDGKVMRDAAGEILWDRKAGPVWTFNGDLERPTFGPSLLIYEGRRDDGTIAHPRCHSFVRDGRIEFCGDCGHGLAGQVRDLVPVDNAP